MILIADDSENDAMAIVQMLTAAGVRNPFSLVADGKEVIAYLKGIKPYANRTKYPLPTVLFLDLKMRRISGLEVLEWLKLAMPTRDIFIVILSSLEELGEIRRGYELGARAFLLKPYRLDDIKKLVRTHPPYWQLDGAPPTGSATKGGDSRSPLSP